MDSVFWSHPPAASDAMPSRFKPEGSHEVLLCESSRNKRALTNNRTTAFATRDPKAASGRLKVNKTCTECTRRKVRCDGGQPCNNCSWYLVEDRCGYRQRNRRTTPSWKRVEHLNEEVEVRNRMLSRILPGLDFKRLPGVSCEHVQRLINNRLEDPSNTWSTCDREGGCSPQISQEVDVTDDEWDESKREQHLPSRVADDVNGLAVTQPRSFLGPSPPSAALRTIFRACPSAKQALLQLGRSLSNAQSKARPPPQVATTQQHDFGPGGSQPPSVADQVAINAYFDHIHYSFPMLDEVWFKSESLGSNRSDSAWVALSNMVLSLGSIAAGDDEAHRVYYAQAQKAMGHNVFGLGSLEMLQALILLGGAYLHYINSPNTAYLVLGTAVRMAFAMALHRESDRSGPMKAPLETFKLGPQPRLSRAESRRRTWWCLVCCDAWGGMYLGRPPITRWDPLTMDTELPRDMIASQASGQVMTPQSCEHQDQGSADYLNLNVDFCKILLDIEHRLAQFSPLSSREVICFENQLQAWENSGLQTPKQDTVCPRRAQHVRFNTYGRFQITRIIMSTPLLLRLAEDVSAAISFTADDWRAISISKDAASQLIGAVSGNRLRTRVFVWCAGFAMFQACMVAVVIICVEASLPNEIRDRERGIQSWCAEIERAINAFKDMSPWRRSTDRYGEVVEALYKALTQTITEHEHTSFTLDGAAAGLLGDSAHDDASLFDLDQNILDMFDAFTDWSAYELPLGS